MSMKHRKTLPSVLLQGVHAAELQGLQRQRFSGRPILCWNSGPRDEAIHHKCQPDLGVECQDPAGMQQTANEKSVSYSFTLRACALQFLTGRNLCLQDKDGFYFTALVSHVVTSLSSGHLISRASSDAMQCAKMRHHASADHRVV